MAWSPLYKIPFLLSQSLGLHVALTPPHEPQPVSKTEQKPRVIRDEYMILLGLPAVKGLLWGTAIAETAVIVAKWFPNSAFANTILSRLVLSGSADNIRLTPMFIFGSIITALGGYIRYRCYRELGKDFTFELSIQKEHDLVTTGPYSYVRHPGYIGVILAVSGVWLGYSGGGSWLTECGIWSTHSAKVLAMIWSGLGCMVVGGVLARTPKEDAMIKQKFGKDWADWARQVPYKLIPGIY